jgi:hypothetical protein
MVSNFHIPIDEPQASCTLHCLDYLITLFTAALTPTSCTCFNIQQPISNTFGTYICGSTYEILQLQPQKISSAAFLVFFPNMFLVILNTLIWIWVSVTLIDGFHDSEDGLSS